MLVLDQTLYAYRNTHAPLWTAECPNCGKCLHYTRRTVTLTCDGCGQSYRVTLRSSGPSLDRSVGRPSTGNRIRQSPAGKVRIGTTTLRSF